MMGAKAAGEFCCKLPRSRGECQSLCPATEGDVHRERSSLVLVSPSQGRESITHRCGKTTPSRLPAQRSLRKRRGRLRGCGLVPRAPSPLLSVVQCQEPGARPALPPTGSAALEKLLTFLVPRFSHALQTAPRSAGESDAVMR